MEPLPNRRGNIPWPGAYRANQGASMEPLPNRRGNRQARHQTACREVLQWSPFRIEGETILAPPGRGKCWRLQWSPFRIEGETSARARSSSSDIIGLQWSPFRIEGETRKALMVSVSAFLLQWSPFRIEGETGLTFQEALDWFLLQWSPFRIEGETCAERPENSQTYSSFNGAPSE